MTTSLRATAQNTDYKATIIADTLQAKEHTKLLQWISPVDPFKNHEAATSVHQKGTSTWVLQSKEFQEWDKTDRRFLWISGFRKFFCRRYPSFF